MLKIVVISGLILVIFVGGFFLLNKSNSSNQKQTANTQTSTAPQENPASEVTSPDSDIVKTATDPKKGDYLTDSEGHSLYTYDKDQQNSSSCTSDCAKTWQPYTENAKTKPTPTPKPETNVNIKPEKLNVKPDPIHIEPEKLSPAPSPNSNVTKFTRDDGTSQYSYKGHALYHFSGDKKPWDTLGDDIGKVWHLARP